MPLFYLPHFNDIAVLRSIEPNRFRTFLLRFDNYLRSQGFNSPGFAVFTDAHLQRLSIRELPIIAGMVTDMNLQRGSGTLPKSVGIVRQTRNRLGTDLELRSDRALQLTSSSFGGKLDTELRVLFISTFAWKVAEALHLKTASDLLLYAQSFPSIVADQLGKDVHFVSAAAQSLRALIQEHVDPLVFREADVSEFQFGAKIPDMELKVRPLN